MKLQALIFGALWSAAAFAQVPEPELCLARTAAERLASAEFEGKAYHFTSEACREQFASEPERYAQLYDALKEIEAEAGKPVAPKQASLVPS